ncbi:MAG: hypothetical protein ABJD66_00935 [Cellulophaga sp.]|uniref:hypothetical protein n=1 Tax=Cellulophaga sp. TaxID=1972202 RepID=UPI003264357F
MKQSYKILLLLILITTGVVSAQEVVVYKKDFNADKIMDVIVNLTGSGIKIQQSDDDLIHIKYSIYFVNYSKRLQNKILEMGNFKINVEEKNYRLLINNRGKIGGWGGFAFYDLESFVKRDTNNKDLNISRKTKEDIVSEIKMRNSRISHYFNQDGTLTKNIKRAKFFKASLVLHLPKKVILRLTTESSGVFIDGISNVVKMRVKRGDFRMSSFVDSESNLEIDDANLFINEVVGGKYTFNNIRRGLIGSIAEATIISEFSNLEIGELQKGNTIKDFSSEFKFYHISPNNNSFNLDSDYSKLNIYGKNENNNLINAFKTKVKDGLSPAANFTLEDQNINLKVANGLIYYHN